MDTKSKVAGFRLSDEDIARLETIAIRLTDGSKTDAIRMMIREKYDHLMASDMALKLEEQAKQIAELRELVQQLINKTP